MEGHVAGLVCPKIIRSVAPVIKAKLYVCVGGRGVVGCLPLRHGHTSAFSAASFPTCWSHGANRTADYLLPHVEMELNKY